MSTSLVQAQKQLNMFKMCGDIDLCLRKMKNKNIFVVGLSRCGKSTLYNNINNVTLMGVAPDGSQAFELLGIGNINAEYKVLVENAEKVNSNSGIASVTLYPNILDKGEYTLSDMAGFMDTRRYVEVIGVSYVLKAAFQKVKQCQFALVVMADYFAIPNQLFRTLKGFLKMFNFEQMSPQTRLRLFQSITFVITKSKKEAPAAAYASVIKNLIHQINNPIYGGSGDAGHLTEILTYLGEHPEQYYIFGAAVINQKASPSTIVQDHFEKRAYFQLKKQNLAFQKQKNKSIISLPFKEDFDRMPIPQDKDALKADLTGKIGTVPKVAKILQNFFKKAIVAENLLDQKLSFKAQFHKMQKFNEENDVYSKEFKNRCDGIEQQNFPTIFSPQDPLRPLKIGIVLAQNAFQLYKLFNQWPVYKQEDHNQILEKFMIDYRDHLIEIIKLFRDSFCSTYDQEQIILKFLFITARTCRQFSMLYQIRPDDKHEMCIKLKDSFQSIVETTPYKEIQKMFIIELFNNIEKVSKKIEQDKEEAKRYANYLNNIFNEEDCAEIKDMHEYKVSKRKFLEIIGKQADSLEDALVALFENFIEHKMTMQEFINKMNDEEDENFPEDMNFKFKHLLSEMAHKILNFERADTYAEDLFAYERPPPRGQKDKDTSVRLKLIIQQAYIAMDIFIYINDVQSVCKSYEVILKNIPEKDYKKQVQFLKGLALYCSKNGRIEQSIILYQKTLSICATGNLFDEYQKTKNQIGEVEINRNERIKSYFGQLKHKKIIDPTDDTQLDKITEDIEDLFVNPYKNRVQQ